MAEPIADPSDALLVHGFAEFALLPDLLVRRLRRSDETDAALVRAWEQRLDEVGYNDGHVAADEGMPNGQALTEFMADDAYWFCRRMGLIEDEGALSEAGEIIARIGETPYRERSAEYSRRLTRRLARQIQRHFVGHGDRPLTDLLQGASAVLLSHGWPWSPELGGLLLSEVDTLLYWGARDWDRAEKIARDDLLSIRETEYRDLQKVATEEEMADPSAWPFFVATRIGDVHLGDADLAQDSPLTTTGLRATAMALVFAQLMSLGGAVRGPQLLRPWDPPRYGG